MLLMHDVDINMRVLTWDKLRSQCRDYVSIQNTLPEIKSRLGEHIYSINGVPRDQTANSRRNWLRTMHHGHKPDRQIDRERMCYTISQLSGRQKISRPQSSTCCRRWTNNSQQPTDLFCYPVLQWYDTIARGDIRWWWCLCADNWMHTLYQHRVTARASNCSVLRI